MEHTKFSDVIELRDSVLGKVEHKNYSEKYILILTVRVTELCSDAYVFADLGRLHSTPILLRSALESYIDLMCIKKDVNHIEEMNNHVEIYKSKLLKESKKTNTMKVWAKFKLAGESTTYNGLYAYLCRSSHGNLDALAKDHMSNGQISIDHKPEKNDIDLYKNYIVDIATATLIEALEYIKFSGPELERLRSIQYENSEETKPILDQWPKPRTQS